ncbi:hypothetical protein ACJMK2_018854 [Sinanodonta woodiana]|uniref:Uncharacterized protein n=1 Tax=Sinanodonta woodiana TaxID=1069815 RepID=A0ABD3UGQ2_SINWO
MPLIVRNYLNSGRALKRPTVFTYARELDSEEWIVEPPCEISTRNNREKTTKQKRMPAGRSPGQTSAPVVGLGQPWNLLRKVGYREGKLEKRD